MFFLIAELCVTNEVISMNYDTLIVSILLYWHVQQFVTLPFKIPGTPMYRKIFSYLMGDFVQRIRLFRKYLIMN